MQTQEESTANHGLFDVDLTVSSQKKTKVTARDLRKCPSWCLRKEDSS